MLVSDQFDRDDFVALEKFCEDRFIHTGKEIWMAAAHEADLGRRKFDMLYMFGPAGQALIQTSIEKIVSMDKTIRHLKKVESSLNRVITKGYRKLKHTEGMLEASRRRHAKATAACRNDDAYIKGLREQLRVVTAERDEMKWMLDGLNK